MGEPGLLLGQDQGPLYGASGQAETLGLGMSPTWEGVMVLMRLTPTPCVSQPHPCWSRHTGCWEGLSPTPRPHRRPGCPPREARPPKRRATCPGSLRKSPGSAQTPPRSHSPSCPHGGTATELGDGRQEAGGATQQKSLRISVLREASPHAHGIRETEGRRRYGLRQGVRERPLAQWEGRKTNFRASPETRTENEPRSPKPLSLPRSSQGSWLVRSRGRPPGRLLFINDLAGPVSSLNRRHAEFWLKRSINGPKNE